MNLVNGSIFDQHSTIELLLICVLTLIEYKICRFGKLLFNNTI